MSDSGSLEIVLQQTCPYRFLNPGNTITGRVVYSNPAADYRLFLKFEGRNTVTVEHIQPGNHLGILTDQVILFSYEQKLFEGSSKNLMGNRLHGEDQHLFRFRVPTNSENRRFVHCPGSSIPGTWRNSVHPLPPSFEIFSSSSCPELGDNSSLSEDSTEPPTLCAVEYYLLATVITSDGIRTSTSLPVLFMPFASRESRTPPHYSGLSQQRAYSLPDIYDNSANGLHALSQPVKVFSASAQLGPGVRIIMPRGIAIHQPLSIELRLESDSSTFSTALSSGRIAATIRTLSIHCTTTWRAASAGDAGRHYPQQNVLESIPLEIRYDNHKLSHGVSPSITFTFKACIPSRVSPSFSSFLIAHHHELRGWVWVAIGEHQYGGAFDRAVRIEPPIRPSLFSRNTMAVLSHSARSQILPRRFSSQT